MGLDWNPANKPKPGHEDEFRTLFTKLAVGSTWLRKRRLRRFEEISIPAFETLAAPRVGIDQPATDWAQAQYENIKSKLKPPRSLSEWLSEIHGLYVVSLLPPCDGIPRYSNGAPGGYVEPYSFRAQFLRDCEGIIGPALLESAYESKLPEALARYGAALADAARRFAHDTGISEENPSADDPDSPEFHVDVVSSAAKWCAFWSEKGHPMEAYF